MSDSPNSDLRSPTAAAHSDPETDPAGAQSPGVLASLPRTRPQRASPRRKSPPKPAVTPKPVLASKRTVTPRPTVASTRTAKPKPAIASTRAVKPKPTVKPKPVAKPKLAIESVPVQGYESEGDPLSRPVQPPGGVDLAASIAELAGELTKASVSTGARLLKDLFSHLPSG